MGRIRVGPARLPSRESPEAAIGLVLERGYDACELDFEGGFWMEKPFAARLGEVARENGVALSIHAPIAAFAGHLEHDAAKLKRSFGMLDHTAGIAVLSGAELVVVHPGFLLGRTREETLDSVSEQLALLRERLEAKGRGVPFGIEVMGRVRDFGSAEDVVELARRLPWVRPVIDFAHLHATSDGAFTEAETFARVLEAADGVLGPGEPFHVHFSDIAFTSTTLASGERGGNEKHHLPYGEGTLRVEPLRDALARFDRPATVISESPDEASHKAIRAVLLAPPDAVP